MEATWFGQSSFRLKGKNVTVVTDPYDSSVVGFKFPKLEANIVTVSHGHGDHNNVRAIVGSPKIVDGPGEYEIAGVSIFGVPTFHDDKKGEERGANTVFVLTLDSVKACHLGDLGHKLTEDQVSQIGTVDVLFIPVGGSYTIGPSAASEVIAQLEPKVVIPMHYKIEGMEESLASKLAPVDDFVSELGVTPVKTDKYVITYDKVPAEMELVILERKG